MASFTNQATLSYRGGSATSNLVTGEVVSTLSAEKTAVGGQYVPGGTLTYVISLRNTGDTPLTALTVSDDLGGYPFEGETLYPLAYETGSLLLYVDGVLQAQPAVTPGPPLVVTGLTIPAGSSAVLVYGTRVTEYAPLGSGASVTNTADLSDPGQAVLASAQAAVTPDDRARLAVTKALSPQQVSYNDQVTYTFQVENRGGAAGPEDLTALTDTFDPILTGIAVTLDGEARTSPAFYSYDEATGLFTTAPGQITVPAASFAQNPDGSWSTLPGTAEITVTGTLAGAQTEKRP